MARILPAPQRSLITALDIRIGIAMGNVPDFTKDWEITYPKFFHMLRHSFPNVRKLRLGIDMFAFKYRTRQMTAEDLDRFLGPWESLVTSRDWELVELRVPESWYPELWPRAECQGGYKLSTIRDTFLSHRGIGCFP